MRTAKHVGRIFAALLLVQTVLGYIVNFVLLGPAIAPPGGFLTHAAAHAGPVSLASLLLIGLGALWVAVATTMFPIFQRHSQAAALWFVALAVVIFAGLMGEGIAMRSLFALSQEYVKAGGADETAFRAAGAVVRSVRNSAHYMDLLLSGGALLVFYGALFRFALIPRALSIFGLATVVVMMTGAVIPLLGYPTVMLMFMPMGLSHLALVSWLFVRGFEEQPRQGRTETAAEGFPRNA